ncbi:glycoside hydrolase superfamily [Umbelopsis sp. PMI_123]|nr:glycoside hydrolase superfamily [Umbelopsis sp. PMI_123]
MKVAVITAAIATALFAAPSAALIDTFLWPIPQSLSWGDGKLNIDNSFKFDAPNVPELQAAVARYKKLIWKERWTSVQLPYGNATTSSPVSHGKLKSITISVKDKKADLTPDVDESYTISIPENASTGTITAQTIWGAMHALETFSQLVKATSDSHDASLYVAKTPIKIKDAPVFPYRGVMLDTARNYYTVDDILRTIDGMSYNKMNVFHWHITDSQSFPLLLESVPELGEKGAYTLHGKLLGYTKKDVKRIIKYARERGVRIVPELDMPAHTAAWKGVEGITTCTEQFYLDPTNDWANRYASEPTAGQLNPINPKTYEIVSKVIDEVTSWFDDEYYHGGGDEPVNRCWEDNKSVSDYMAKHNVTGNDLLQTFLTKELAIIKKNKKTAILWEDAATQLHLNIPKDTILQVWTGTIKDAVTSGYKVIASSYNFFYLDCRSGNWNGNDTTVDEQVPPTIPQTLLDYINNNYPAWASNLIPSPNYGGAAGDWCAPFKSWQRVYSYDVTYQLTKEEAKSVLGGEVALWSEQSDPMTVDMKIWPRAAAAAEMLWSGRYDSTGKQRDIGEAMPRMFDWRYRLVERGLRAEPIQPLWCGKNPHGCDLNYPWVFTHPNDGGGY